MSEYNSIDELLEEFATYAEDWDWSLEEKMDAESHFRLELYIEQDIEEEFHSLGTEMGVNTAVTGDGERYTISRRK